MTIYQLKRDAEKMEVPFREAALCRLRHVRSEMYFLMELIESFSDADPMTATVADIYFGDSFRELAKEQTNLVKAMRRPDHVDCITQDMIEHARAVPVTSLMEFTRGRALAWCHDDHSPSIYVAPRVNRVVCPVCDLHFDSIGVLIARDGMSFHQAVRQLAT